MLKREGGGSQTHHNFKPSHSRFHADVPNGSTCHRLPDPAGPISNHCRSSKIVASVQSSSSSSGFFNASSSAFVLQFPPRAEDDVCSR
eukprot:3427707-Rhodomonas_salina.1